MIPVLFVVTIGVFGLLQFSGIDPIVVILGIDADPSAVERVRKEFGLDQPAPVQYAAWLGKVVTGDLGISLRNKEPVLDVILRRVPVTLELAALSMLIGLAIALPLGIIAALKRNTWIDGIASATAVSGLAIPNFWLGILLILLFSLVLGWVPPSGFVPITDDPLGNLKLMILPAITMGTALAAVLTRMTRSSMLEVLSQDYIRTARAKGLEDRRVILVHALKNSLIPVVTIAGLQTGRQLGGAVIVESIFSIPGLGRLLIDSIFTRDYPMIQGAILFITVVVLVTNLLVDLAYSFLDPRIKYS